MTLAVHVHFTCWRGIWLRKRAGVAARPYWHIQTLLVGLDQGSEAVWDGDFDEVGLAGGYGGVECGAQRGNR